MLLPKISACPWSSITACAQLRHLHVQTNTTTVFNKTKVVAGGLSSGQCFLQSPRFVHCSQSFLRHARYYMIISCRLSISGCNDPNPVEDTNLFLAMSCLIYFSTLWFVCLYQETLRMCLFMTLGQYNQMNTNLNFLHTSLT